MRPSLRNRDRVSLASHVSNVPAYEGKPAITRATVLFVWAISGKGTKRDPWTIVVNDDAGHFWHFEPSDLRNLDRVCPVCQEGACATKDRSCGGAS